MNETPAGKLVASVETQLQTEKAFCLSLNALLSDLELEGCSIRVSILSKSGDEIASYGGIQQTPFATETDPLGQFQYRIEAAAAQLKPLQQINPRSIYQSARDQIVKALELFWGTRDGLTMLYRSTESSNLRRLEATLSRVVDRNDVISVLHIDLDHFKKVNTEFGEPVGDQVLGVFAARIRKEFGEDGIIIRKGGEEFSVFLPKTRLRDAVLAARRLRLRMESEQLESISRTNTCSIGVSYYPLHYAEQRKSTEGWFDYLLKPTMEAETRAKNSGRNCISLPKLRATPPNGAETPSSLRWVAIGARLGWFGGQDSFQNDFQRVVCEILAQSFENSPAEAISASVERVKQEFAIEIDSNAAPRPFMMAADSPGLHPFIWALVILSSALRASFRGTGPIPEMFDASLVIEHTAENEAVIDVQLSEKCTLRIEAPQFENSPSKISAGKPWLEKSLQKGIGRLQHESLSPVLVLQIGQLQLPEYVRLSAASVIEIDDRPVVGGGLPDFWQSNLSRVLRLTGDNPNIFDILVVGDIASAKRTVQLLTDSAQWNLAAMNRGLSIDLETLQDFQARKLRIKLLSLDEEVLAHTMYEAFLSEDTSCDAKALPLRQAHKRRIATDPAEANLSSLHGLVCSTAGEAYPKLVNLLRSEHLPINVDHFRRPFVELTAFKLALTAPMEERVPEYWAAEEDELDAYYHREFDRGGLFGNRFYSWGGQSGRDQVNPAIQEAAHAIKNGIASRRIMLFVADSTDTVGIPLGLVGLQMLPRMQGRWSVSFAWMWRTVEALVGLPFSLYGTIRFSEELLNKLNEQLVLNGLQRVIMGNLTYIALSLHMFKDEGDEHIGRAIVASAL